MIYGGYILKARKMLESDLMNKPPLWSKLWDWMLLRAEWRTGAKLERGQFITSVDEMREAMSWLVGYRRVTPTKDEIRSAYEGFAKAAMVTTTKTTRGMIVTITNYDTYQRPENYEARNEARNEKDTKPAVTPHDSKEVLSIKNEAQEKDNTPPVGVSVLKGKRERKPRSAISVPFADDFATFWEVYPRKVAKPNAEKAWAKLVKAGELPDMDTLLAAVANQADAKDWRTDQTFCPHPATWLNGKRWEDSVTPARGVDTSWHVYRDWSTRYLTRRRAIHPDDTPEPTQDIVDAGAQWLGEWICPDGFSEPQIKAGIVWLLEKPRRCQYVKHLGDLGLYSQGVGGNLGTWCVNGAMGMDMPADPFCEKPILDGGPDDYA